MAERLDELIGLGTDSVALMPFAFQRDAERLVMPLRPLLAISTPILANAARASSPQRSIARFMNLR